MFERLLAVCKKHYPNVFGSVRSNGELMKLLQNLLADPSLAWMKNENFCQEIKAEVSYYQSHTALLHWHSNFHLRYPTHRELSIFVFAFDTAPVLGSTLHCSREEENHK